MSLLPSSPSPARRRNWRTRYVFRPRNRAKSRPRRCSRAVALSRARARARAPRPRAFPTPRHSLVFATLVLTVVRFRFSLPLTELGGVRRGSPEQGQGEEAREAPLDADRDHGRGGAGETREEGGEESGEGACIPHPLAESARNPRERFPRFFSLFFRTTLCQFVSLREKVDKVHFTRLTSPLPYVSPSPLVANSQEAKAEARKERLDFELNGPNKQMTKKERKRLEAEGLN